ncbi:NAD-dependent epimerase/dehydratase family protein [Kineococcus terrestris]|uniref:NAD-dependent epimerase/dehydratase family protein n=1 Tax=Kineococcus terrestris TaxID=2044856 RepID=UPI0034DAED1D
MRIAVTGASGNVGTALLRRLSGAGHELVGISRRPPDATAEPYDRVEWHHLDVAADPAPLRAALRGCDAVVHLAWLIQPSRDERELTRVNVGGSRAVVRAALDEGVPHLVHASSVGTYSDHPHDDSPVDESWPVHGGVRSLEYSRSKAAVEAHLDEVEREHDQLAVARVRPALVLQHDAASAIGRYFLGALVPTRLVRRVPLPVLPLPRRLRLQVVHADDVADAFARVVERGARGAFHVADEPVLGGRDIALALRARRLLALDHRLTRAAVAASYRARVHPVPPGWLDLGLSVPVMDTARARTELGWEPRHRSGDVLRELLEGLAQHGSNPSPVLRPRGAGGSRVGV